jgi:magnesium chelatase family protein
VPALREHDLTRLPEGETSTQVRTRVQAAHVRQLERQGKSNSRLAPRDIDRLCRVGEDGATLLKQAIERINPSARAYHRVLKLARTIADLAGEARVGVAHVAEAIQYRRLDRAA